ncbi:MAG: type II toxin-antitoxin system VapC family toxin [Mycobacterium sp.]|nr:type II toxin-antitoxin system VapC family toxin [Mycobacterium sp.]
MKVLLDTPILLWLVSDPTRVAAQALTVLAAPEAHLWATAASAWEISIKTRLGRLDGEPLLSAWTDILTSMRVSELPIDAGDAILAGRLSWGHKDPFDRAIVAQALRRNLTIATRDTNIIDAGLTPILTA